jgi:hypothetical protein
MINEILNNYSTAIKSGIESHISYNKVAHLLPYETHNEPITGTGKGRNGIAIDKKAAEGNPFVYVDHYRAPNGVLYPVIRAGTHEGGTHIFFEFHGYKETRNDCDYTPIKFIAPPKPKPAPKKLDALAKNHALYASGTDDVNSHAYAVEKQLPFDGIGAKRVTTWRGDCLMLPMRDMQNAITAYQFISDKKYLLNGKETNKEMNGVKGFSIIGGTIQDVIERGAWFGEGAATMLAVYHADGKGRKFLSNADKLPAVITFDASNLGKVIDEFVNAGMVSSDTRIAADNDVKPKGNTGLFVAMKAAKKHGCKVYIPQRYNHELGKADAVDFADTLEYVSGVAISNPTDYALDLLGFVPEGQIKRTAQQAAFTIARERVPSKMSADDAIATINAILIKRGADVKKIGVDRIIKNCVKKRNESLKKLHKITQKLGINRVKFDQHEGNDDIAKFILEVGAGIFLDNRGLGAGKTKLLEILREKLAHEYVAYVCHRKSLTADAATRLNLYHYENDDISGDCKGAAICVNSMAKNRAAGRFNVLFLDEFRQQLEHITKGIADKVSRQAMFDELVRAIELADLVICSDADLNDRCVEFLKKHAGNKTINLIETVEKPNDKSLKIYRDFDALRANLLEEVLSGKPVMIANTSREVAEQNELFLIKNGIDYDSVLTIHSKKVERKQAQDDFLANPNQNATLHFIINHSPSVGSGVSIEKEHFTINYLFDSGILGSNEKLQMLARNRMTNDYRVAFAKQKNFDRVTDLDLLTEGEGRKAAHYVDAIRVHGKTAYVANELGHLRIELTAERNEDLNDFANNFVALAELKGMTIDYSEIQTAGAEVSKELKKEVKETTVDKIINAPVIDDQTAKKLNGDKSRSYELDRHLTTVIAGTAEITLDDVENVIYGKAISQVMNFETLQANIIELKQWDKENAITQNKTICKTSIHKLGNHVINELFKHDRVDRKTAQKLCDYLNDNAAEIAANGLGNYTRKSKNPLRTLGTFIEKFGHELIERERIGGRNEQERFFDFRVIDCIDRYTKNRASLR